MATSRICSIEGCCKRYYGRGWCQTHYARWRKHGDPLKTVATPAGEPGRFYREVVLTCNGGPEDECLIWPYARGSNGYARMFLDGRDRNVSRVLCEEINGSPSDPWYEAAHLCGKGNLGCVTKSHLDWKTPADNQLDRIGHGTSNRGERQGRSKLTEADVRQIRARLPNEGVNALAREFDVTHGNIIAIRKGKSWSWLE